MNPLDLFFSRPQVAHIEFIDEMNGGDCDCLTHQYLTDLHNEGQL